MAKRDPEWYIQRGSRLEQVLRNMPRRRRVDVIPPVPKLLANPMGEGYGRVDQWPFSRNMAVAQASYRRGVERAIENTAFASNWRFAAGNLLTEVYELVAMQNMMYWDLVNDELEEFVEGNEF